MTKEIDQIAVLQLQKEIELLKTEILELKRGFLFLSDVMEQHQRTLLMMNAPLPEDAIIPEDDDDGSTHH